MDNINIIQIPYNILIYLNSEIMQMKKISYIGILFEYFRKCSKIK